MAELELTRTKDDRRIYALEGVGSLRLGGWASRGATAEAHGREWRIERRGIVRRVVEASDATGAPAGEFRAHGIRRGGTIRWGIRELELRPASVWRERYALAEGERELAVLDGKGWGRRPVKVTVEEPRALDPGLLLFAAFVVRLLAEDDGSAAAGGATAATTG